MSGMCVLAIGLAAASALGVPTDESAAPQDLVPATLFSQSSWTLQFYGSTALGDDDHGSITTAHAGGGYFLWDRISLNLELLGGFADSEVDDDGVVAGFDLLLRWHFLTAVDGAWSLYLDGGAGFQQADTNFPSDSHHNFRPQGGIGGTLRLLKDAHLMGGVRWLHISNAGTSEHNDGLDGAQVYLGLMLPF